MAKASGSFFSSSLHSGSDLEFKYAKHSSSWEKEVWLYIWEEKVEMLKRNCTFEKTMYQI